MRIFLRIMGRNLFESVTKELAAFNSSFPRHYRKGKLINWQLELLKEPFEASYLDSSSNHISVVLIEAHDVSIVEELRAISHREYLGLCSQHNFEYQPAPVILIFDRDLPTTELLEMPKIITDWVSANKSMHELVRRIFGSLKNQRHLQEEFGGGVLSLISETRTLCYSGDMLLISPSEVPVAELFLSHIGSVIPMEDIALLFKLAGRSTEGSNIRVTMFQLRFKIEAITRCYYTLISAYKEGYVLRTTRGHDPKVPVQDMQARQEVAIYGA